MPLVAAMNTNGVSVRVSDERHPANRTIEWFLGEIHSVLLEVLDGQIEILHFQGYPATVRTWFPVRRHIRDRDNVRTHLVFHPEFTIVVEYHSHRQIQHAFIEGA